MQYSKPMIDLVYEIRRRVDPDMKPTVKMANPEMLKELAVYYSRTKDTVTKTLIKELLHQAGDEWHQLLEPVKTEALKTTEIPKQVVKVYRGQTTLTEGPHPAEEGMVLHKNLISTDVRPNVKPVRMYRGQPIT